MAALRLRVRLLQAGLLLPVLLTGVLGAAYLAAVRARQQAVEVATRELTRRIAEEVVTEADRIGTRATESILRPAHAVARPTLPRLLAAVTAATDSLRACRCGPIKEHRFAFVWVPGTGEFLTSTPIPPGQDPRGRLRSASELPRPSGPQFYGPGGLDAGGPWVVNFTRLMLDQEREVVVGIDLDLEAWWRDTFRQALRTVSRRYFPMLADPDTAVMATLQIQGREVARGGPRADRPPVVVSTGSGSGFELGVALNPATLPLVLAVAAPAGYPMLVGVLAASLLASLVALLLLHQVHRTVAQREAFVASISHGLRTPLTEVLLHADTLQLDRQTPEAKRRAASTIVRETRRLIGLVENALTIAGAGRAKSGVAEPVVLGPLVRESLAFLAPALQDRRVTVQAELDESARSAIEPVAVDRIVINLVENAVRYGPEGQRLRVALHRRAGMVLLEVDDEGPGVPVGERRRIFQPFRRGTLASQTGADGVGLGLAIVRHLAAAAGGSVAVSEAPGGGARFTVSLPEAA